MGVPVHVIASASRTKTGRRALTVVLVLILVGVSVALTPLVAIPFAVAGAASASTPLTVGPGGTPAVSGDWAYPLAGEYTKGRGFGYNPVEGCSYCSTDHMGYDMAQGCGATIYAAGPGTVLTASSYQGYGNAVRIDHGNGLVSLYGHMEWESLRVSVGQVVTAGTPVGAEGNTGNSFGCHLHFELRLDGTSIDPQPFMAAHGLPLI